MQILHELLSNRTSLKYHPALAAYNPYKAMLHIPQKPFINCDTDHKADLWFTWWTTVPKENV